MHLRERWASRVDVISASGTRYLNDKAVYELINMLL